MIKILCVADGALNFRKKAAERLSLNIFLELLRDNNYFPFPFVINTAHRREVTCADYPCFEFTSETLEICKYDVLFLFGFEHEEKLKLTKNELRCIETFMKEGGGVFGAGDHKEMGRALCGDIPRLRKMRKWVNSESPPELYSAKRNSTTQPGPNGKYDLRDQADSVPQTIYPYFLKAERKQTPHKLLCHPRQDINIITSFPDHGHEGECNSPQDVCHDEKFSFLDDNKSYEFPRTDEPAIKFEAVAASMSSGGGYDGFDRLEPKKFIAITAYDGHKAGCGRIVADSTWHHFVNGNLNGRGKESLKRIMRGYYINIADWLTPAKKTKEASVRKILHAMTQYPFVELHTSINAKGFHDKAKIGYALEQTLRYEMSECDIDILIMNLRKSLSGGTITLKQTSLNVGPELKKYFPTELLERHVALGAVVNSVFEGRQKRGFDDDLPFDEISKSINESISDLNKIYLTPLNEVFLPKNTQ